MNRLQGSRRVILVISSLFLACGLIIAARFGWSYANQTIWLNHHHLAAYAPLHKTTNQDDTVGVPRQSHSRVSAKPREIAKTAKSTPPAESTGTAKSVLTSAPSIWWNPVPANGSKIGTLSIPSIHLTVPVVQGTTDEDLAVGAGHEPQTAFPGQGSNVLIAGHRDTVFSPIRFLKRGADIRLQTPYGTFVYQATGFQIVAKDDVAVMAPTPYETLTLSTCYPFFYFGHAPKRYIVYTRLVSEPKRNAHG